MILRIFGVSVAVALVGLVAGVLYGGPTGLLLTAVLIVLEVSISFDNAVVNATILQRMSRFWQQIFLTVGVVIAVFGMRLVFPLAIVGLTASLGPIEAVRLALEKGDPDTPGTYGYLLHEAHPAIAAFGGIFLLMLFLDFIFAERDVHWIAPVERVLARAGRLGNLSVLVAIVTLAIGGYVLAPADKVSTVLISGLLGLGVYLAVNGLGEYFDSRLDRETDGGPSGLVQATGKAAFFLFLYLEVIDASFSFDGVVGAFAITSDPVIIALGLGVGAFFIRSITIYLVRTGSLARYPYLEHGAMWAIGALAAVLIVSIAHEVPEWVTGALGVGFIVAALITSVRHNRLAAASPTPESRVVTYGASGH
ncbi:MAG TPA: DUF475 domain-containing protein [Jatrophihabitans sp.]|jgi:hypothetical protein